MTKPRIHGQRRSEHPNYGIWSGMLSRCYNPRCTAYLNYGGRGISVCDRWREDFAVFAEDMGPRPSLAHSIDRINVNGNYEPGNCRWATVDVQAGNRRPRKFRTVEGSGERPAALSMLVDWMNANEVNQAALSALVGVKQPSICRWMDGSVTPDFANCLALEIVTGIPAAIWLTPEERLRLAALRPYAVTVAA